MELICGKLRLTVIVDDFCKAMRKASPLVEDDCERYFDDEM